MSATAALGVTAGAWGWTAGEGAAREATNQLLELPTIVVTATRTEEAPFELPYAVDVVGSADLERTLPRTTVEALRAIPSVMLQKTAQGQGSPYLRGFTGFRTLMLVDGIRLNNSTFRDGPNQYWNTIDVLGLERVEVVRGPGSVLYGSDAIGGTVQAMSRGRMGYGAGFDMSGGGLYRWGSADDSHTGRSELSVQQDGRLGLHAGASLKEYGQLPRTGPTMREAC